MNAHRKSLVILLSTLLLGTLLGASGTSVLQHRRSVQMREARTSGGMVRLIEDVVKPSSPEQRENIRAVVNRSEDLFRETRRMCSQKYRAQRDSMVVELNAVLTPAQQSSLHRWINRERNGERHHGRTRKSKDEHQQR